MGIPRDGTNGARQAGVSYVQRIVRTAGARARPAATCIRR